MTVSASAPEYVKALRDMLLQVTGAVAADSIYYPTLSIDPDAGTGDSLPAWLITIESYDRTSYAAGAQGLPSGSMDVTIFYSTGSIETVQSTAETIATELQGQDGGLAITSITTGPVQDAAAAMQVTGSDFYACTISIDWGIS